MQLVIKEGFGYWDTTRYPYGGCFRRTIEPLAIDAEVLNTYNDGSPREYKGKTADGRTLCVAACSCVTPGAHGEIDPAHEVGGVK